MHIANFLALIALSSAANVVLKKPDSFKVNSDELLWKKMAVAIDHQRHLDIQKLKDQRGNDEQIRLRLQAMVADWLNRLKLENGRSDRSQYYKDMLTELQAPAANLQEIATRMLQATDEKTFLEKQKALEEEKQKALEKEKEEAEKKKKKDDEAQKKDDEGQNIGGKKISEEQQKAKKKDGDDNIVKTPGKSGADKDQEEEDTDSGEDEESDFPSTNMYAILGDGSSGPEIGVIAPKKRNVTKKDKASTNQPSQRGRKPVSKQGHQGSSGQKTVSLGGNSPRPRSSTAANPTASTSSKNQKPTSPKPIEVKLIEPSSDGKKGRKDRQPTERKVEPLSTAGSGPSSTNAPPTYETLYQPIDDSSKDLESSLASLDPLATPQHQPSPSFSFHSPPVDKPHGSPTFPLFGNQPSSFSGGHQGGFSFGGNRGSDAGPTSFGSPQSSPFYFGTGFPNPLNSQSLTPGSASPFPFGSYPVGTFTVSPSPFSFNSSEAGSSKATPTADFTPIIPPTEQSTTTVTTPSAASASSSTFKPTLTLSSGTKQSKLSAVNPAASKAPTSYLKEFSSAAPTDELRQPRTPPSTSADSRMKGAVSTTSTWKAMSQSYKENDGSKSNMVGKYYDTAQDDASTTAASSKSARLVSLSPNDSKQETPSDDETASQTETNSPRPMKKIIHEGRTASQEVLEVPEGEHKMGDKELTFTQPRAPSKPLIPETSSGKAEAALSAEDIAGLDNLAELLAQKILQDQLTKLKYTGKFSNVIKNDPEYIKAVSAVLSQLKEQCDLVKTEMDRISKDALKKFMKDNTSGLGSLLELLINSNEAFKEYRNLYQKDQV